MGGGGGGEGWWKLIFAFALCLIAGRYSFFFIQNDPRIEIRHMTSHQCIININGWVPDL